eukprot:gene15324-21408_t
MSSSSKQSSFSGGDDRGREDGPSAPGLANTGNRKSSWGSSLKQALGDAAFFAGRVQEVVTRTAASAQEMLTDKELRRMGTSMLMQGAQKGLQEFQKGIYTPQPRELASTKSAKEQYTPQPRELASTKRPRSGTLRTLLSPRSSTLLSPGSLQAPRDPGAEHSVHSSAQGAVHSSAQGAWKHQEHQERNTPYTPQPREQYTPQPRELGSTKSTKEQYTPQPRELANTKSTRSRTLRTLLSPRSSTLLSPGSLQAPRAPGAEHSIHSSAQGAVHSLAKGACKHQGAVHSSAQGDCKHQEHQEQYTPYAPQPKEQYTPQPRELASVLGRLVNRQQIQNLLSRIESQVNEFQRERQLQAHRKQMVTMQIGLYKYESMPKEARSRMWYVMLEKPELADALAPCSEADVGLQPRFQGNQSLVTSPGALEAAVAAGAAADANVSDVLASESLGELNAAGADADANVRDAAASASLGELNAAAGEAAVAIVSDICTSPSESVGEVAVGDAAADANVHGEASATEGQTPYEMVGGFVSNLADGLTNIIASVLDEGEVYSDDHHVVGSPPDPCTSPEGEEVCGDAHHGVGTPSKPGSLPGGQLASTFPSAGARNQGDTNSRGRNTIGSLNRGKRAAAAESSLIPIPGSNLSGGWAGISSDLDFVENPSQDAWEMMAMSDGMDGMGDDSFDQPMLMADATTRIRSILRTLGAGNSSVLWGSAHGGTAGGSSIHPAGGSSVHPAGGSYAMPGRTEGGSGARPEGVAVTGKREMEEREVAAQKNLLEAMLFVPWVPGEGIPHGYSPECRFAMLVEMTAGQEEVDDIIMRDVSRTFPGHPFFSSEEGQLSLFRVLKAYSLHDLEVAYCQGMAFLAGVLLMYLPEEVAFRLYCRLLDPDVPKFPVLTS